MRLADKKQVGESHPVLFEVTSEKGLPVAHVKLKFRANPMFFLLSLFLNEVASRKLRLIIAISCPIVYFSVHYYPDFFFCWSASVALSPSVVHHLGRPWFGGSPNTQGLLCTVVVTDFENLSGTAATTSSNPCQTHSI